MDGRLHALDWSRADDRVWLSCAQQCPTVVTTHTLPVDYDVALDADWGAQQQLIRANDFWYVWGFFFGGCLVFGLSVGLLACLVLFPKLLGQDMREGVSCSRALFYVVFPYARRWSVIIVFFLSFLSCVIRLRQQYWGIAHNSH
jgi:hypothetical protein